MRKRLHESTALLHPIDQVAKPESPFWATGRTINFIGTTGKVRNSEVCVGD
jgi:hypothetical protein